MKCKYCGVSLKRQLILALMIDLCGAQASTQPDFCYESPDEKHDFTKSSESESVKEVLTDE